MSSARFTSLRASRSEKGAIGVIYDRVSALNAKVVALDIRVRVLELALSSRQPDVVLSPEDIKVVKSEIKRLCRQKSFDYASVLAWGKTSYA